VTGPEVIVLAVFARDEPSTLHDLARAFHAGDPAAAGEVAALVATYLAGDGAHRIAAVSPGDAVVAVAVPGHRAGTANRPVEALLRAISGEVPGLAVAPGVLARVADAPEARRGDGVRDPAAEALTLRWHRDRLGPATGQILLVDDVVRTGATFEAALRAAPAGLRRRIVPLALFRARG
jgi:hypothetical protein